MNPTDNGGTPPVTDDKPWVDPNAPQAPAAEEPVVGGDANGDTSGGGEWKAPEAGGEAPAEAPAAEDPNAAQPQG